MNREAIYAALFKRLEDVDGLKTSSRVLKHFDDVPEQPALFQAQKNETAKKQGRGIPTKWEFNCQIYIYVKSDDIDPPSALLNDLIDAVDAAIAPEVTTNTQTLGGLVVDCWIDGQIETDEGTLGSQAVAIIPIKIYVV